MNLFDLLDARGKESAAPRQQLTTGIVIRSELGAWQVNVANVRHTCENACSAQVRVGDHVWIALGRGTPRIIGVLGKDVGLG